eukprot:GHVT01038634.1.p1 GENE.GHVT01038634.1~~GHVT01038634.1.p1  ORF type:complete len:144 (-),score=14.23 GHVT01038634.1:739-1170(-)
MFPLIRFSNRADLAVFKNRCSTTEALKKTEAIAAAATIFCDVTPYYMQGWPVARGRQSVGGGVEKHRDRILLSCRVRGVDDGKSRDSLKAGTQSWRLLSQRQYVSMLRGTGGGEVRTETTRIAAANSLQEMSSVSGMHELVKR